MECRSDDARPWWLVRGRLNPVRRSWSMRECPPWARRRLAGTGTHPVSAYGPAQALARGAERRRRGVGWPFWPSLRPKAEEVGLRAQPTSRARLPGQRRGAAIAYRPAGRRRAQGSPSSTRGPRACPGPDGAGTPRLHAPSGVSLVARARDGQGVVKSNDGAAGVMKG